MATLSVTTQGEFTSALSSAVSGDVIELSAGSYTLALTTAPGPTWSPVVTIRSADLNNLASLSSINLTQVDGLVVEYVTVDYQSASGAAISLTPNEISTAAANVTIQNVTFNGDIAFGLTAPDDVHNGYATGKAVKIGGGVDNIVVQDCLVDGWWSAFDMGGVDNVTIQRCTIQNTTNDGLTVVASDTVTVKDCLFWKFNRNPDSAFHCDGIQFSTAAGHARANSNITLDGNMILKGIGSNMQGIFTRNAQAELAADASWNYSNITIKNNLIWLSHSNCLLLGETTTGLIQNNTLIHNIYGAISAIPVIEVSGLSSGKTSDITVENNIAHGFPAAETGLTLTNNLTIQRDSPDLANYYEDLFVNALNDGYASLEDLQALPGGTIELGGYGAPITTFNATPSSFTAVIRPERPRGNRSRVNFDAGYSAGPSGRIST